MCYANTRQVPRCARDQFRQLRPTAGADGRRGGEPFLEFIMGVNEELAAHAVVAEAAELRTGDLPLRAVVVGHDRREVDGDDLPGNGVLLTAHYRQLEALDDVLRADVDDHRSAHFEVELVETGDVVLAGGIPGVEAERGLGWDQRY